MVSKFKKKNIKKVKRRKKISKKTKISGGNPQDIFSPIMLAVVIIISLLIIYVIFTDISDINKQKIKKYQK